MKTVYFIGGPADLTKMRVDDDLTRCRIIKVPAFTVDPKPVIACDGGYNPRGGLREYKYRLVRHPDDPEIYLAFIVNQ